MRVYLLAAGLIFGLANLAHAEGEPSFSYMPTSEVHPGTAPGLKSTELSPKTRVFTIEMSKGDDVVAGLTDFAEKNHLTNAHFSAIGAFGSAIIGWSDRPKKA